MKFFQILKDMFYSFFRVEYTLSIWFGIPGSGKTTFAAYLAKRCMKKSVNVWSNVPIKGTFKLNPKEDIGVYMIENGRVLIDEAGIEYDNRNFKEFSKNSTYFYKYHRHYKVSVDIFSQGFDDMDKKLRTLAQKLYVVKKTIIPFFIKRYQISKKVGINDLTKEICDEYYRVPFSSKFIFSPVLWDMFDTYSRKELEPKVWEKW